MTSSGSSGPHGPGTTRAALTSAERDWYFEGIRLFNQREFFDAHEVWENIWRKSEGTGRHYFQGLIQCAVALEHCRRGNARGALNLQRSSWKHFTFVPGDYLGLNVDEFLKAMEAALGQLLNGCSASDAKEISFDGVALPHLLLNADFVADAG